MAETTTFRREGRRLLVGGPVLMAGVMDALRRSEAEFAAGVDAVDLSGVTEVDSSALGLLMEWLRRDKERRLVFANPPANLLSLAHLYGVRELLPIPGDA
jgi:phospholipid transport system transporter-binding protein